MQSSFRNSDANSESYFIEVEYEELSTVGPNHRLRGHTNLQDRLVAYLNSEQGQRARRNANSRIVTSEIIHYGERTFRVETTLRAKDLYVTTVVVYDSDGKVIFQEVDNGVIGGYNRGTTMIPIQHYFRGLNGCSPGALIRSQAFRISEALRFRRSMRYRQLPSGSQTEMWPDFMCAFGNGQFYITPFEYANVHREQPVDFGMFHKFYGKWEDLSDEDHPVVAISQKIR